MARQNDFFQRKTSISIAGYSMNVWLSIYRKCQKDRIFHFICQRIWNETYKSCKWIKPFSAAKKKVKFNCPRRGTIIGMRSLFNESSSDRRYGTCLDNTTITTNQKNHSSSLEAQSLQARKICLNSLEDNDMCSVK